MPVVDRAGNLVGKCAESVVDGWCTCVGWVGKASDWVHHTKARAERTKRIKHNLRVGWTSRLLNICPSAPPCPSRGAPKIVQKMYVLFSRSKN